MRENAAPATREAAQSRHAAMIEVAWKAGRIALRHFREGAPTSARTHWKAGGSPVTEADHAVDAFLAEALPRILDSPVHSEEHAEGWGRVSDGHAFVVDPIDGTRNFAEGGQDWCIVIGLLADWRPVAGVVHLPARGITYSAFSGGGAYRDGEKVTARPARPSLRATGPRGVIDALRPLVGGDIVQVPRIAALAHRVLAPLTGAAEIGAAHAGGHDWDIVASDCILAEAGAALVTLDGEAPSYRLAGGEQPALIAANAEIIRKIRPALLTKRS
jgi:myo-inositol-1(or 4)-monophosphatase